VTAAVPVRPLAAAATVSRPSLSRPPLRYHGSKWRIAPWIIGHFPPHRVYVEAFGGGGGVLLRKERSPIEVYNDLDGDVVNFFRVVRNRRQCRDLCARIERTAYAREEYDQAKRSARGAVERARCLVVRGFMGFNGSGATKNPTCGFRAADYRARRANNLSWLKVPPTIAATHARLQGVVVENLDALRLLRVHDGADTLFYLDPPYLPETRTSFGKGKGYLHEFGPADHEALAQVARGLTGFAIVSGYPSPLYDALYAGWTCVTTRTLVGGVGSGRFRTEALWLSPRTAAALQPTLFTGHT
jgi:DNA adenine methylase